jgi:hypothetical protein
MPALPYVGAVPAAWRDIATYASVDAAAADERMEVEGLVSTAVTDKATVAEVRSKDNYYALDMEYKTKDATRNVPLTPVNVAGSPVTLEGNGTIATSRFPTMGAGYLRGPWGLGTVTKAASVGVTPVAIATFTTTAIPAGVTYQPVCFVSALVKSSTTAGRPVMEVRMGTSSQGALVAVGRGRTMFTGLQSLAVMPVADTVAWMTGTGAAITLTLWLSDAAGAGVSIEAVADVTGSAHLLQAPAV